MKEYTQKDTPQYNPVGSSLNLGQTGSFGTLGGTNASRMPDPDIQSSLEGLNSKQGRLFQNTIKYYLFG